MTWTVTSPGAGGLACEFHGDPGKLLEIAPPSQACRKLRFRGVLEQLEAIEPEQSIGLDDPVVAGLVITGIEDMDSHP